MFDGVQWGWLAGDDYRLAAQRREREYRKAVEQAGFTELPEEPGSEVDRLVPDGRTDQDSEQVGE